MSGASAARFFDAIAGRYERSYALSAEQSRLRMNRVLGELPKPPGRVLDLGVGTGRELSGLLDAGFAPTGVDVSFEMLERCAHRGRPVALVRADFWEPLPFAQGSFDSAVALHGTLAHPPDDGALTRLARDLARVVRPEGIWIAEAPAPAWLELVDAFPQNGERSVRRTGPQTCICEDHVVGAAIEAHVLSDVQWRTALGEDWTVRIDPLGDVEWFVVATRA